MGNASFKLTLYGCVVSVCFSQTYDIVNTHIICTILYKKTCGKCVRVCLL